MLTPVRRRIAEKREMLVPDREAGRLVRRAVPPAQRAVPCLTPGELTAVARLAKAAERHYRTPQDIEWAVDVDLQERDNVVLLRAARRRSGASSRVGHQPLAPRGTASPVSQPR